MTKYLRRLHWNGKKKINKKKNRNFCNRDKWKCVFSRSESRFLTLRWTWRTSVQFREHQVSCQSQKTDLFSATPRLKTDLFKLDTIPRFPSQLCIPAVRGSAGTTVTMRPTQKRSKSDGPSSVQANYRNNKKKKEWADKKDKVSIRRVNTKQKKKIWNSVGHAECQSLCLSTFLSIKPLWESSTV